MLEYKDNAKQTDKGTLFINLFPKTSKDQRTGHYFRSIPQLLEEKLITLVIMQKNNCSVALKRGSQSHIIKIVYDIHKKVMNSLRYL